METATVADKSKSAPKYRRRRRRKSEDTAFVEINGKRVPLGFYDTPESWEKYHRVLAEWESNGRRLPQTNTPDITICEIIVGFLSHCKARFGNRRPAYKYNSKFKRALLPVAELYDTMPAADFGPRAVLAIREAYIATGWTRMVVNERVQIIKAMIRWAVREELIPASVWHAVSTVEGLRAGESSAAEPRKIKPVSDADVEAVLPHVLPPVRAMIELQLVTGMRPGEACAMRSGDIDVTNDPWVYRPRTHKSERHGIDKEIFIGKRGQAILQPFLRPNLDEYIFRPDEAVVERQAERRRNRKTKLWASHIRHIESKRKGSPQRTPRPYYDTQSYRQAIHRACDKVGIDQWGPHQLRHSFATRIRKLHGVEAARICLGHQHLKTAEIYAERDAKVAASVARKHG